jgi:hypothetical protein
VLKPLRFRRHACLVRLRRAWREDRRARRYNSSVGLAIIVNSRFVSLVLVLFAVLAAHASCEQAAPSDHKIVTRKIEIPAREWVNFESKLKLKTPGDSHEVCFYPSAPFTLGDGFSIAAPDGEQLVPKARLVSDAGEYVLENLSLTADALCVGTSVGAQIDNEYRGVRVWSPGRLSLERIEWNSGNK